MFQLLKTEGKARRGVFTCAHGTVQTPVFMNVGTQGAIKGALSAADLKAIGCQVELSNTYHLHLRPGDKLVAEMGGDLCGQPETFCRSQGAPRPGAGGTGRKKSVAADCAGGTQWNTGLPQWRGSPWFLMPCGLIRLF